jgi:hypothetical protein
MSHRVKSRAVRRAFAITEMMALDARETRRSAKAEPGSASLAPLHPDPLVTEIRCVGVEALAEAGKAD